MKRQAAVLVGVILTGVAHASVVGTQEPPTLKKLLNAKAATNAAVLAGNPFKGERGQAQRRAAFTLAVQTAVHWRYSQIDKTLKAHAPELNRVFDFRVLMLDHGRVLPPVITASGPGSKFQSADAERSVIATYRIEQPAKLASTAPTWRTYLIHEYPVGDRPNAVLYPRNGKERTRWDDAARRGWKDGVALALRLYKGNLAQLQRDYVGMARFERLAEQGVVSIPLVAANQPRIAVEGKELAIGVRQIRLTRGAAWQATHRWKPEPGHG